MTGGVRRGGVGGQRVRHLVATRHMCIRSSAAARETRKSNPSVLPAGAKGAVRAHRLGDGEAAEEVLVQVVEVQV